MVTTNYTLADLINIPAPASALSTIIQDKIAVGSVDGSVRLYELPSTKVAKAITKLGEEVASLAWENPSSQHVWIASGIKARRFDLQVKKIILSLEDALNEVQLGEDDEDVLNELSINHSKKVLTFCSDNGTVGVLDLTDNRITRMKNKHGSISSSVKFVPDRPAEIVSGGYDSAMLHFDHSQRNQLSQLDIAATPPESGISLSPPFVLSTAISSTGLIAAGIADGRLWIGSGGDKLSPINSKPGKKRARKWGGLQEENGTFLRIAEGPVVACAFVNDQTLVTASLLGKLVVTRFPTLRLENSRSILFGTQRRLL
ncbi:hypothetical protein QCA50_003346 [Cerrena zonata]|uniref:WD40 repeat-like protein n=1 Tax=Cerrena zonata TaxID=2478898 RepID=A0AAW0GW31_9APHY